MSLALAGGMLQGAEPCLAWTIWGVRPLETSPIHWKSLEISGNPLEIKPFSMIFGFLEQDGLPELLEGFRWESSSSELKRNSAH